MRVLIMGRCGASNTRLAAELLEELHKNGPAEHLSSEEIRKEFNDSDYSEDGEVRTAQRMRMIADRYVDNGWPVICDLICPTPYTRLIIDADITVWLDTVMTEQDLFIEPTEDEYTLKVIDDNTSCAAVIADLVNILE